MLNIDEDIVKKDPLEPLYNIAEAFTRNGLVTYVAFKLMNVIFKLHEIVLKLEAFEQQ